MVRRAYLVTAVIAAMVIGLWLGVPTPAAHAELTPAICDQPYAKYYCSRASFTRVTSGFTINSYQHKGAIDGGADKWRRYYVQESAWPSGTFLYNVPSTDWKSNVSMPSSYTSVSRGVTYYQHINAHFGFQYYECVPGQCYYWWGDTDQIFLAI